jgi:hypothetical protein
MIIRKKDEYVVDGMGRVSVYTVENSCLDEASKAKEPFRIYEGYALIGAPTPNGIMQVPVEFRMENITSVEDAFSKFQEAATARFKIMMADAREQAEKESKRIITAPANAIPKLVLE